MEILQKLKIYKEIQDLIQETCNKFARGKGYGYSANSINVDFINKKIYFYSTHYDGVSSIFGEPKDEIPFDYLSDDSKLETESKKFYEQKNKERLQKHKKENELKNDPKVQEYLKLQNQMFRLSIY